MPLISFRDVSKSYPASKKTASDIVAVDSVNLDIDEGDIFGIIGYSGAGKSTLVRLINALEPVTSGSLEVRGVDITRLPESKLRELRSGIGMIFQRFNLFQAKSVRGNVAYPLKLAGIPQRARDARVSELLEFVGLSDKAANYPDQLSGGQMQRVGIARALATSPQILLADEATSALDPETTQDVLALLRKVNKDLGVTIVVITHEMDVIQSLATKVAVMESGRVVEHGSTFDIFSAPQNVSTRKFVSTVIRGVPDGQTFAELSVRHPGTFVTVTVRDGYGSQTQMFRRIAESGLDCEVVYGGVHDIQGRAFGRLTLSLSGDDIAIAQLISVISGIVEVSEVHRG